MDREEKLETLINLIVDHYNGECSCDNEDEGFMCLPMKFLTGNLSLKETLDELC